MEHSLFLSHRSPRSVHTVLSTLVTVRSTLVLIAVSLSFCLALPPSLTAQTAGRLEEGITHFEAERFARAQAVFEALVEADRRDAAAAYWLGRTLRQEGEYKDAVDLLEKAVDLDETNVDYQRELYLTYVDFAEEAGALRAVSLAKKMVRLLHSIVELDSNAADEREELVGFYVNAPKMFGGGDIEQARRLAGELQNIDQKRGRLAFIMIHEHEGENDQVEREYRALIEEYPDELDPPRNLGLFYHNTERYAEAIATFRTLTERFPDYLYGWYLVGRTAAVSGLETELGISCMEHYLAHEPPEDDPSHAAAHWRLGMICEKSGNLDRARAEYEASLELDPDYSEARAALRRIRP